MKKLLCVAVAGLFVSLLVVTDAGANDPDGMSPEPDTGSENLAPYAPKLDASVYAGPHSMS